MGEKKKEEKRDYRERGREKESPFLFSFPFLPFFSFFPARIISSPRLAKREGEEKGKSLPFLLFSLSFSFSSSLSFKAPLSHRPPFVRTAMGYKFAKDGRLY